MRLDEVAILLTCHSFEDFPVFHRGTDADSLLACWTALWHPQLIANCRRMPTWYRLDDPPAHDLARLLVRPTSETGASQTPLVQPVADAGGLVIEHATSRDQILEQALAATGGPQVTDGELAADYMALGFAYLQTELLTRQMRYATRIAETAFADQVVKGAEAAASGDTETSRSLLQSCFDLLSQERNHYYAVDVYLLDISLLNESLLGAPLERQLANPGKSNLLLEARLLAALEANEARSWEQLKQALAENHVGLIGGEFSAQPVSLLSTETVRRQLELGLQEFQQRLGRRPHVYGRRSFGLAPTLPQMLLRLDFTGALHATFDGGRFPEATQAKSRWEGDGQFSIDAITRAPLDATQSSTFLNLATALGESMDMEHIATRCFVHWAGEASPWYDELRRVSRYTRSLGRFVTVDEYFQETYDPGIHDRFKADQYHSPWLQQRAAASDPRPLSACSDYWRHYVQLQSWWNCSALWLFVEDCPESRQQFSRVQECWDRFNRDPLDGRWQEELKETSEQLNAAAAGLVRAVSGHGDDATIDHAGCTLVNPWSFPRRVGLAESPVLPATEPPIYATDTTPQGPRVVVDIPAMGVARVRAASRAERKSSRKAPPLAEGNFLRNEFLEAYVDPQFGAMVAFHAYHDRTNRLSQQLACRIPGTAAAGRTPPAQYSTMIGEGLDILEADSIVGRLQSRGRLVNDGRTLAEFVQTFTLWRGSRVVEIQIELQPHLPPGDDPWNQYVACRFAWASEAADVHRGLNDVRQTAQAKRLEAPLFLQVDDGSSTTTILTGGLPFHRRIDRRMIDTLLITGHEHQRQFRLGLGLDVKQPFREALALLAPNVIVPWATSAAGPNSLWLFHVDARHVLANHWQPVWDNDRVVGVRLRLNELEGRSGRVRLQSFRRLSSARKIDGQDQTVEVCQVDGQQVVINVSPHEQIEVEALFA